MKVEGVYIAAAASVLPTRISRAADAVGAGILDPRDLALCPAESVRIAETPCWEMGLAACTEVLEAGEHHAADVSLVVYTAAVFAEEHPWSPAHRIARMLGADRATALEIAQMSNGGAAAVAHAAAQLMLEPGMTHAIAISSADFTALPFPRWSMAPGVIYGDGAAAALLSVEPGPLALRAVATTGDPTLEASFPAGHPFKAPDPHRRTDMGVLSNASAIRTAVRTAVDRCLDEAALDPGDPRIVAVYPTRLGRLVYRHCVQPALPEPLRHREVLLGENTGHLGAGDMLANLAHIFSADALPSGAVALLVTTGAGFTASCLAVENIAPAR
ncbi:beta-ketoacyl-[acyl-carrier-protein] synthase family protein [Nocardia goodfellowii]|uniref:3-oxoacyl-[acyl-carrier-protein] synthase-3 n=1 Tax=Nocardia goodfellowii TaxID=882446 RepID=A0ABS4QIN0_9NOCA|nr:hypothetical protein [Nocardia goodfellowii]MBP2191564.1 3-oxoacyl-[acyl-carrier-protein] synthase-3 [Nocardia goodfellowii]